MSDPQFDVERATAGLVLALFLGAALLLGAMYYFVLRDAETRAESSGVTPAVRVESSPVALRPRSHASSLAEESA
jgi:hypothetical protein